MPPEALSACEQTDPKTQLVTLQNQVKQATEASSRCQQQHQQVKQTEELATQQVALLEQQVATMQARLADKQQENQLEPCKLQMKWSLARKRTP